MTRPPLLFALQSNPVGGVWLTGGDARALSRLRRWEWRDGALRLEGGGVADAALTAWAEQLAAVIEAYQVRGPAAFLRLSNVTKVGPTWSLPAVGACPVIDETCIDCYALKGRYLGNPQAQAARLLRLEHLRALLAAGRLDEWVDWMAATLAALPPAADAPSPRIRHFRWHDSGDVFHADYARAIVTVCARTPTVLHWLPTRMGPLFARLVSDGLELPRNLSLRISCHRGGRLEAAQRDAAACIRARQPDANVDLTYTWNGPLHTPPDWRALHAAHGLAARVCPVTIAPRGAKRSCVGCRNCWGAPAPGVVVYALHRP